MNWTIADNYFGKALDYYPDIENVSENLKYALSYDPEHTLSNWLFAKLQMEVFQNYEEAEYYFEIAMASDPRNLKVCQDFVLLKIYTEKYLQALKLLEFMETLPGSSKPDLHRLKALTFELMENYDDALKALKVSEQCSYNERFITFLKNEKKRVSKKQKQVKKTKRKAHAKPKNKKIKNKKKEKKKAVRKKKKHKSTFRKLLSRVFGSMF